MMINGRMLVRTGNGYAVLCSAESKLTGLNSSLAIPFRDTAAFE
jgi:hypothetical protein